MPVIAHEGRLYRAGEATGPDTSNATEPGSGVIWEGITGQISDPTKVENLVLTDGNAQFTAEWDLPRDGGSPLDHFDIRYRERGTSNTWSSDATTGTELTIIIDGLSNGIDWEVQVRAENEDGRQGEWSDLGFVSTAAQVPDKIECFTAAAASHGVFVSLVPPADNGSSITNFEYQWRAQN